MAINFNNHKESIMKIFQNVVNSVFVSNLLRNLPFRMFLGRLGIRLMAVGRFLQVRYANWNSEFRLKREFSELYKSRYTFHVSERVTDCQMVTFHGIQSQTDKQMPLVKALLGVQGVSRVSLEPYRINVDKGEVFTWDELLTNIEKVILEHLAVKV